MLRDVECREKFSVQPQSISIGRLVGVAKNEHASCTTFMCLQRITQAVRDLQVVNGAGKLQTEKDLSAAVQVRPWWGI